MKEGGRGYSVPVLGSVLVDGIESEKCQEYCPRLRGSFVPAVLGHRKLNASAMTLTLESLL
jgi:hypothetical protein